MRKAERDAEALGKRHEDRGVKKKNQRLTLLLLAIGAVLGAVLLAMSALQGQGQLLLRAGRRRPARAPGARPGGPDRRHGAPASTALPDGVTIDFIVGDETAHTIPVRYHRHHPGAVPARIAASSPRAASSRATGSSSSPTNILAKHDENYMPPELTDRGKHKTDAVR